MPRAGSCPPAFCPSFLLFLNSARWVQSPPPRVAPGREKVPGSPQPHRGHPALAPSSLGPGVWQKLQHQRRGESSETPLGEQR